MTVISGISKDYQAIIADKNAQYDSLVAPMKNTIESLKSDLVGVTAQVASDTALIQAKQKEKAAQENAAIEAEKMRVQIAKWRSEKRCHTAFNRGSRSCEEALSNQNEKERERDAANQKVVTLTSEISNINNRIATYQQEQSALRSNISKKESDLTGLKVQHDNQVTALIQEQKEEDKLQAQKDLESEKILVASQQAANDLEIGIRETDPSVLIAKSQQASASNEKMMMIGGAILLVIVVLMMMKK